MATHTPGPWQQWEFHPTDIRVIGANSRFVFYLSGVDKSQSESAADIALVLAAPDLFYAACCALADLEGIMPEFDPDGDRMHPGWQTIKELRAAINKTKGVS